MNQRFIDAADERFYVEKSNHNDLTPAGRDHIVENFANWTTENRVSNAATIEEIAANDYNLNVSLYVDTTKQEADIDVADQLKTVRNIQERRSEAETRLTDHMEALQYE